MTKNWLVWLVAGLCSVSASCQIAAKTLDEQIKDSCQSIVSFCKAKNVDQIAIGTFNGPGIGGVGLAARMEAQMKALGATITNPDSDYELKLQGRYQMFPEGVDAFKEIDIRVELVDELGASAKEFNETYVVNEIKPEMGTIKIVTEDPPEMSVLLGQTTHFGETGEKPGSVEHKDLMLDQFKETLEDKPAPYLDTAQHIARSSSDSPYGLQLLADGRPVPVFAAGSKARAILPKGKIFSVMLINNDPAYDAAVELCIDGINTFAFSEVKGPDGVTSAYKNWIVPPAQPAQVYGWFVNHQEQDLFKVTGFKDSAVFRAKGKADVQSGAIVASFAYAWRKNADPPPTLNISRGESGDAFIGFGGREKIPTTKEERYIGPVRDVIVIHYRDR